MLGINGKRILENNGLEENLIWEIRKKRPHYSNIFSSRQIPGATARRQLIYLKKNVHFEEQRGIKLN